MVDAQRTGKINRWLIVLIAASMLTWTAGCGQAATTGSTLPTTASGETTATSATTTEATTQATTTQATTTATPTTTETTAPLEIGYVRPDAPHYVMPAYNGTTYLDKVPDTLDMAEMAKLALNGLGGPLDPNSDYELYFMVNFFRWPPAMTHDFGDGNQSKFLGPFVLNRIISGSTTYLDAETGLINAYLKSTGPDYHYYTPYKGKPWIIEGMWAEAADPNFDPSKLPNYGGPGPFPHRMIEALLLYYERTGDPMWKKMIEGDLDIYKGWMVDNGDWGYFGTSEKVPTGFMASEGWNMQSLGQIYKVLKLDQARVLGKKFATYLIEHAQIFKPDGRFIFDQSFQPQRGGAHFHIHTNVLLGLLEYARATHDQEILDFVNKSFLWAKSSAAYSSTLVGFFPENVRANYPNTETCAVADMVDLALMLTQAGEGDYLDDADRWIRNQFAECQLTSTDWISKLYQQIAPIGYNETKDRVGERNVGGFAGWPTASDWALKIGIQQCCTGNGARTIYYIWENILKVNNGNLKVDFLLNRASPWADVYSYIPYQGQVDIKTKQAFKTVSMRLPEWVDPAADLVTCTVDGQARTFTVSGRYVQIKNVGQGQTVSLQFPIAERTVQEHIGDRDFTLIIKGNTVVSIDPPGANCPLYQREKYRLNQVQWVTRQRFVSDELIDW